MIQRRIREHNIERTVRKRKSAHVASHEAGRVPREPRRSQPHRRGVDIDTDSQVRLEREREQQLIRPMRLLEEIGLE